jgi:hypothetical protein
MENVLTFYNYLEYFTTIWQILCPSGILCGHLVYISPFWYVVPRKIWQPWLRAVVSSALWLFLSQVVEFCSIGQ